MDKQHISLPLTVPDEGGKAWLPGKPERLGEWTAWTFDNWKGWTLKLHPVFEAQVRERRHGDKGYEWGINTLSVHGLRPTLAEAQRACEEHIVRMVREMLPAYRIVHERVQERCPGAGTESRSRG